NSYYYSDNDKTIAASLSSQTVSEGGILIEGGVAEVEISNSIIKIRLHGSTGSRKINLPFSAELMVPRNDVTISLGSNSTEVNVNYSNSNI
ncbi:MAG: hypothetical protein ABR503_10210, partial [Chitinophagaceae bacterium]